MKKSAAGSNLRRAAHRKERYPGSLQPGELTRPLTREELLAFPPSLKAYFHGRTFVRLCAGVLMAALAAPLAAAEHGGSIEQLYTRRRRKTIRFWARR